MILGKAPLAYLIHVQTKDGDSPQDNEWEWVAHAFGEQEPQLAERLVATVRAWDRHIRADHNDQHADPALTVHPADTPDDALPAGDVLDKEHCRTSRPLPAAPVSHSPPSRPALFDAAPPTIHELARGCKPELHPLF
ncbi:hypothetical protein ACIPRL_36155 [Streptomyces sp. NPDC090085]|uniref:hypothetical protein n=1 Tax=Streptomyces sp. NPDC090085 TaxID=3365943 RepID=UPI003824505F